MADAETPETKKSIDDQELFRGEEFFFPPPEPDKECQQINSDEYLSPIGE